MPPHEGLGDEDSLVDEIVDMGKRNIASNQARMRRHTQRQLEAKGAHETLNSRQAAHLELTRLHDEYIALVRDHDLRVPCPPFDVFAQKVALARDHVRRVSGTSRLSMSVRLVEGRPKVIIEPS